MPRLALYVIACFFLTAAVGRSADAAVPLEVYGRLPALEDVALSPDGARIAYVRTTQDMRVIAIVSLADQKVMAMLRLKEEKLRNVAWADNNHLMIVTSATSLPIGLRGKDNEWFLLQVYDVVAHQSTQIPNTNRLVLHDMTMMNVISGYPMVRHIEGHTVLFVPGVYLEGRTLRGLFRFDCDTGTQKLISEVLLNTQGWLVDADGKIIAQQEYDQKTQAWHLRIIRDGHLQDTLSGHDPIDVPDILGFGPIADTLLMEMVENDQKLWRLVSLKDGTLGAPMAEGKTLNAPMEDHLTHRMIGGVHIEDDSRYVFFDPNMQAQWDAVTHAFADEHVRLVSTDDAFRKLVVRVDGQKDGLVYELVDLNAHKADVIGDVYEGLAKPLEVRRITYTAADGLQIPAYLTLPHGRAEKTLPFIVLVHGGPAARDTSDFDWWSQTLAEQNYAVLRPNYRGSDLGRQFTAAGFGEWGRKMRTDVSDGVRYLAKAGIVDPARVCIVGASYGGYAALAGVTLEPGVYRCAVSVAGLSDLNRMLAWVNEWSDKRSEQRHNWTQRYWNRFMGVSGPEDPALDTISPIKHLSAVNAPVLLIHGLDDTVVPYEQRSLMFDALKSAKKDVEFVTLQHADHWLSRTETRLQMLQASVAFLRAHNPPD
jgi:dipeptidyl aminopeptidase/acylaminoacyl peptidase